MQREIESLPFRFVRHPQADEYLDHEQDNQADDRVINEDRGNADALIEELTDIAFQNTRGPAILLDREYPGQQRTDDAADRMHAEAIQRIVIAEHVLQAGTSPVADDARGDSDHKGPDGSHETGSRCNGDALDCF